jgi:hypothetical protein
MSVKLLHFRYEIYHDDVMLARDIIDLLKHTFGRDTIGCLVFVVVNGF